MVVLRESSYRGEVVVQRCPTCGLHITWPRLTEPQENYMQADAARWEQKYGAIDRGEVLHDRHANYLEEVALLKQFVPAGGIVLDVGCNAGWLLGYIQKDGTYEIEGIEPGKTLAEIARRRLGVPIHEGFLGDLTGRDGAYSGLTATDVIEHVNPEDQAAFLADMRRLLKPGGYVFIKTPNAGFTAFKSRLIHILPPVMRRALVKAPDVWNAKEHVVHWDPDNMARFFGQNGFEVVKLFVPLPVQTRNSPLLATVLRRTIYVAARLAGGGHRVPRLAQDIFLVARKPL